MRKVHLVLLDSSTLDRGDLNLSDLERFGTCEFHAVTGADETAARLASCEIALTNKVVIDREVMDAAPGLKLIVVCATGVNNVDLDAAREKGIVVSNVSGYSTDSVAQHAFSLILNLATHTHRLDREREAWSRSRIFTRLDYPVVELAGRTMGIVGLGSIGTRVGELAQAFGMRVQCLGREGSRNENRPEWPRLPRPSFFESSDVVSLHCPLTTENRHMIDSSALKLMKRTAFLINTGRGPLVDETALLRALERGDLGGAGLDVLEEEPPSANHPLLNQEIPNLIVTPHTAWSSLESRRRLLDGVLSNIESFLEGSPKNRVA